MTNTTIYYYTVAASIESTRAAALVARGEPWYAVSTAPPYTRDKPTGGGPVDASTLLAKASNLSDVANAATARTNLGLGTAATTAATAYATAAQGTKADSALQAVPSSVGAWTAMDSFATNLGSDPSNPVAVRTEGFGNRAYVKGRVLASGAFTGSSSSVICTLPSGLRPLVALDVPGRYAQGGTTGTPRLLVGTDGTIICPQSLTATGYIDLGVIHFPLT